MSRASIPTVGILHLTAEIGEIRGEQYPPHVPPGYSRNISLVSADDNGLMLMLYNNNAQEIA
jgi:hypothetical protein